jgi:hypothetical protein
MSITLQTVTPVTDANFNDTGKDNVGNQTQFVAVADVKNMDPCIFNDKKNPADPTLTCTETFTSRKNNNLSDSSDDDSNDASGHMSNRNKLKNYKKIEQNGKNGKNNTNSKKRQNKLKNSNVGNDLSKLPDDMYVKAFYVFMTAFSLYVFYRFMKRVSKSRS